MRDLSVKSRTHVNKQAREGESANDNDDDVEGGALSR